MSVRPKASNVSANADERLTVSTLSSAASRRDQYVSDGFWSLQGRAVAHAPAVDWSTDVQIVQFAGSGRSRGAPAARRLRARRTGPKTGSRGLSEGRRGTQRRCFCFSSETVAPAVPARSSAFRRNGARRVALYGRASPWRTGTEALPVTAFRAAADEPTIWIPRPNPGGQDA
jgi:hypothetical protein